MNLVTLHFYFIIINFLCTQMNDVLYIESVSKKYNFSLNMLLLGQNNVFQLHTTFITTSIQQLLLKFQQYKRNEQAFDHDLHRFMLRNGLQVQTKTTWHHSKVGLFQLFMAVFERGGYQKVSLNQYITFSSHF